MAKLLKYRIKCTTEGIDKFIWLEETETAPIICPTNSGHTVDLNTVVIIETNFSDTIKTEIVQEASIDPDISGSCVRDVEILVKNGINPTVDKFSMDYLIDMIKGGLCTPASDGDIFSVYTTQKDDPALGTLTAQALVNDVEISAPAALFDILQIRPGIFVSFDQNKFEPDKIFEIKEVDKVNNKLKFVTGTKITVQKEVSDPFYIRWPLVHQIRLNEGERFEIDPQKLKPTTLDPGSQFNFNYKHFTAPTSDSTIYGLISYRY